MSTTVDVAAAAAAAARLVPAAVPLYAAPGAAAPDPGATAVAARVVGERVTEVALVVGPLVAAALAEAGGGVLEPTDALRPALQAAVEAVGGGVLEPARLTTAAAVTGAGAQVLALDGGGATQAWLAVRPAAAPAPRPAVAVAEQRGAALRALYDVELTLTAELGRTRLPLRQVLDLTPGTVLELDRAAGGPADVVVNGRVVARGEVVVVDEDFAIRVTEIVSPADAG
ncbi:MAG: flagellar motor switch protein FliN [Cellulomonas sp.]|uniref:flagellar motor switch protein FliN n=1 Tax=Cellulomonas sp. TaxID=40001 RepID=UPI0019FFA995|nr:flagellar motor switch protein FliN [Cellulomonas sp.]MBF0689176.1 flagellar motor switch protein FliN [Cellulomonas sp.]